MHFIVIDIWMLCIKFCCNRLIIAEDIEHCTVSVRN